MRQVSEKQRLNQPPSPFLAAPLLMWVAVVLLSSVGNADEELPATYFVDHVRPILQRHCYSCHGPQKQKSSLRLDVKSEAFKGGEAYGPGIIAGKAKDSPVIQFVSDENADLTMPPEGDRLSPDEIDTMTRWVNAGAVWPDGVDLAKLEDRTDHWSFKPAAQPQLPEVHAPTWPKNEIDRFVLSRLEEHDLHPAAPADCATWLRRATLDLTGLPATPEEIHAFIAECDQERRPSSQAATTIDLTFGRTDILPTDAACRNAIERLLQSPRYGEHWAQHWLDVVRYADTHGFEVNTPRPNAWPYRDYVIDAFNNDTPYDRFVSEQLAGDAMHKDAATGFLVTAAVLLPGQIGQDDASKRLARQDSLAEMMINTSEAFLGLSIGCARCHDHKFDAISQRDYYSMQAFFSGVHYGDRPIQSTESAQRRAQAEALQQQVAEIDHQLARYEPIARVNSDVLVTDAKENEHRFETIEARFVRFTIHDSNLHPSLGLIEPCIDEFEIFSADQPDLNIGLSQSGTQVTASGSRSSASHRLEYINDGMYGNGRSWMSDEAGRGWVQFELKQPTRINRIVWGRDRNGQFSDRLATAFTLEAGITVDSLQQIAMVPPARLAVAATMNVDRFAPVTTQRVRFTILETNSLEPCIDELEIFDTEGNNVALATSGTIPGSSGDAAPSERHRLEHINDGQYGNSRSWMSGTTGGGWVELTFDRPHTIDRIAWGRDREGKFSDRLAIRYTVETADADGQLRLVADSTDRRPFNAGDSGPAELSIAGLLPQEAKEASRLQSEKSVLEEQIAAALKQPMVYAGTFQTPETTRLLFRGDPEQPREEVSPTVLTALASIQLPVDAPELQRRQTLAAWITDPQNPLTARVMVNRIWQWHFGTGLVDTASDFGRSGTRPTHPELLDWLATEFVQSGWSVKHMHRLIMSSASYRQSGRIDREALSKDADARLLWRFPGRRMEAETIRDSILAVSGRLNLQAGGPGFDLFQSRGGLSGFPPIESFDESGRRRMIYAHKIRMEREIVFGAFDCPDAGQSTAKRRQSTTPIQALNLFNSQFTMDEAAALSARLQREAGDNAENQIRRAYQLAFGRDPEPDEATVAAAVAKQHGMTTVCRAIFNSNEFLFLP